VTFTKTGTNTWSYNVTLPDKLAATSGSAAGTNTVDFTFGSSAGTLATVNPATNLIITGPNAGGISTTINAPIIAAGASVASYAADLQNALNAAGITAN